MEGNSNKKHKTAYTSILSWKQFIEEGLPVKEREWVLKFLSQEPQPRNSRQIANSLRIEKSNITRTVYELGKEERIEVKYLDRCPITQRLVKFYGIKESREGCK